MECDTCGGTDFIKESGYFFCSECQTQSQEVREHVFQDEITNVNLKSTKKIRAPKADKSERNITSFECYNIVMASLTQQLINLGADSSLKPVVKCLWMRYLEKLEVIYLDYDEKPKLPIVNVKRDFKILYDIKKKRKRRKSSSDESTVTNSTSTRRERTKKKRELAQAQYEEFSQKSNQESTSLHNETLGSIKSSSDRSVNANNKIRYNRYCIKELRKKMSQRHYEKHKLDHLNELNCHKFTYKDCSKSHQLGVHFLSPIKLYCTLYLGLLIIKDKIQLGDLLRFIREGHLSFNNYTQLFPENYTDKFLNIRNNCKNVLFSNRQFRVVAAKLAKFLEVTIYIGVPDLVELGRRYCQEMNLPDEIFLAVKNLLSKIHVKLKMTKKGDVIPNYEGRIMSLIIFTLKLLFGLDGETENHLSRYAQLLDELNLCDKKMFDIKKWMIYIEYRNLIMSEHHFPTSYETSNSKVDSNLLLQYIKSHNIALDENSKLTREMQDYKELLTRIQNLQSDFNTHLEFPSSLTPFLSHCEVILKWLKPAKSETILAHSFRDENLDFLLTPNKYLLVLNESVIVKHRGANNNWIMDQMKTIRSVKNISRKNHRLIPVKIVPSDGKEDLTVGIAEEDTPLKKNDPDYVQQQFQECRRHIFKENASCIRRVSKHVNLGLDNINRNMSYTTHYNPYERYWLYLQMNLDLVTKNQFEQFFKNYNSNFKLVFKECCRITEQNYQELYTEFQFTELYLVYTARYCDGNDVPKPKRWLAEKLGYYIDQAENLW